MSIKNVALIGASGTLGPHILSALLSANFNVTILTRPSSTATYPPSVRTHPTDFTSATSLASAFQNQDAVIDSGPATAFSEKKPLVDAALKAGVKRFIPSEFGADTRKFDLNSGLGKILGGKTETVEYLVKLAGENSGFSWTGLATGSFLDWALVHGQSIIGFSLADKKATILDSGNEPFYGTNLPTIGFAVAQVLQRLDETANKYLTIAGLTTTQNEILSVLEEETGEKWSVTKVKSEEVLKLADEKLAKGDYSAVGPYLQVLLLRDGKGPTRNAKLDNEVLGLPNDDLRSTIRAALA